MPGKEAGQKGKIWGVSVLVFGLPPRAVIPWLVPGVGRDLYCEQGGCGQQGGCGRKELEVTDIRRGTGGNGQVCKVSR